MKDKLSDNWQTPDWLFKELNEEFNFDVDLCANYGNNKCYEFATDYLKNNYYLWGSKKFMQEYLNHDFKSLQYSCAFINPPYSNPKPFIEKAWEDSKYCKIVCLVKCDPSTKWWATFWDYEKKYGRDSGHMLKPGPKPGCEVRFFPKRIKFEPPKELLTTKCANCLGTGETRHSGYVSRGEALDYTDTDSWGAEDDHFKYVYKKCKYCIKGTITKKFSSASFPCALVIMDRRGEK